MSTTYIEVSYYSDNFCLTKRHFGKCKKKTPIKKINEHKWFFLGSETTTYYEIYDKSG